MVATELENLPTERLEAEICASAAHLAAAECRLLLLIGEFDRRDGAGGWGWPPPPTGSTGSAP